MAFSEILSQEFLDYKRRVHPRRAQTGLAPGDPEEEAQGGVSGASLVFLLIPFFVLSALGLAYMLFVRGGTAGSGSMLVAQLRGKVRASDGLKDWDLRVDDRLHPGQRVVCGRDGAVELRGADPENRLRVFEGGSFLIETLKQVGEKKFLLEGKVESGEVMIDFRSDTALWGVDVGLPTGTHVLSQRTIMFKVSVGDSGSRVVVGDGSVAALGPGGDRVTIRADQRMLATDDSPTAKPEGVNVLSERWNL